MNRIRIDREEKLEVDKSVLPPDAEFKGYEEVVVQDLEVIEAGMPFGTVL